MDNKTKKFYNDFKLNATDSQITITCTKETFERTESGKSWKRKPQKTESEIVSIAYYENYIQSIACFAQSATQRVENSHTCRGYLPTKITTVPRELPIKIVVTFKIVKKGE